MRELPPTGVTGLAIARGGSVGRLREAFAAALEGASGFLLESSAGEYLAAFDTAAEAVRFGLAASEVRGAEEVTFAAHVGQLEPHKDEDGRNRFVGFARERLTRIAAAANPGQLLVTARVWRETEIARESAAALAAVDFGELRIAGLEAPEHLFEVRRGAAIASAAGLPARPPRSLDATKTNLPAPAASFVGRDPELEAIGTEFAGGARVATLHGPGGIGKTRLALRWAALALEDHPGGVWLADLGEARSPDGLCSAISRALGATLADCATMAAAIDALGAALAERGRTLLILDHADFVSGTLAEMLSRWRTLAPDARFLVTAADPLRAPGERARLLEPFTPGDALRLLTERARSVDPDLSGADARPAYSELARRLENIPLALELAAARAVDTAPGRLLEWARAKFPLAAGARDPSAWAATTTLAIGSIWETLEEWEQFALAQCSIFRGGFSLEAAEDVLDVSRFDDAPSAVDVVQSLWDRALLRAWEPAGFPGELRFAMAGPVLAFGAEKLEMFQYGRETSAHHALHYLDLAEDSAKLAEKGDAIALARLALELENIASVLQASLGEEPPTAETAGDGVRAVLALEPLLAARGPRHVRLAWMEAAIAVATRAGNPEPELLFDLQRRRETIPV